LIDLGKDGFHLGDAGIGVWFDLNGNGVPEQLQWVKPHENDAFLTADWNGNGVVDDGSELFGNLTPLILEGFAPSGDGFAALAQYDDPQLGGNGDGQITSQDAVWPVLRVWLDSDADGVSLPGEIMTIDEAGITELGIDPKANNRQDPAGNWLPLSDWAQAGGKPAKMKMIDVFFLALE
jgi:hypothetical protein